MKWSFFLLFVFTIKGFGQNVSKIDILGYINEKDSEKKIEFASVQLFDTLKGITGYGTMSDSAGAFFIPGVKCQTYKVIVSRIGYKAFKQIITVLPGKSPFSLSIKLIRDSLFLTEAVVKGTATGPRSLVDKILFIPDSTVLKNARNGLDVIGKAPYVTVNKATDEVKVLGNSNVLILVDGIENGRDLKAIDPKDIEKIEVITNPSTKYDSEVATVINIIMRKDKTNGLKVTGNIDYFSQKDHYDGTIGADYACSKFRIFGSAFLQENLITTMNYVDERQTEDKEGIFRTISRSGNLYNYKFTGELYKYGIDFYPWKRTLINFTGSYAKYRNIIKQNLENEYFMNDTMQYTTNTFQNNTGTNTLQNYTIYFKQDFGKEDEDHEFIWNTNFYNMQKGSDLLQQTGFYYPTDTISANRFTLTKYSLKSINSKLDYTFPLFKVVNIDVGGQYYNRIINSSQQVNNQTQNFDYFDTRLACYFTSVFKYHKLNVQAGIRYEYSQTQFYDTVRSVQWHLMPSLAVLLDFGKNGSLKLSYKNTLKYPDYYYLNPFVYYSNDSLTVSSGNPILKPQRINSLELNYAVRKKSNFISTSLLLKRMDNTLGETTLLEGGRTLIEKVADVGWETQYGAYLYFQLHLFSWLETSTYFKGYYDDFQNCHYNGFEARGDMSFDVSLPLDLNLTIEGSGEGTTREYNGYKYDSPIVDDITLSRSFIKNQLMISCSLIKFFLPDNWKENNWDMNYHSYTEGKVQSRCVLVRINYFFKIGRELKNMNRELNMENDQK